MSLLHIKNIIQRTAGAQNEWKITLLNNWSDIMGKFNVRVTLEKINNDSIIIGVTDSCWLQELYMLSPTICTLINQRLDQPRIKTIRFKKITPTTPLKKRLLKSKVNLPERTKSFLSGKETYALKKIDDQELKEALENFHARITQGR